jgi:hypothetical protein
MRAWATLAAFAATLVVPFVSARHVFRLDDAACATESRSGRAASRLGSAVVDDRADHCALCHWLRAVGGSQIATGTLVRAGLSLQEAPQTLDVDLPRSSGRRTGPARAPPHSL